MVKKVGLQRVGMLSSLRETSMHVNKDFNLFLSMGNLSESRGQTSDVSLCLVKLKWLRRLFGLLLH